MSEPKAWNGRAAFWLAMIGGGIVNGFATGKMLAALVFAIVLALLFQPSE